MLGNLLEGNVNSPFMRYYGGFLYYARQLLGYSLAPLSQYKAVPSALEQFETSLRDPVYYQLVKRIVNFVEKYQSYQGPYSASDLVYPGVSVEGIKVDKLITYFDYFYSDISNGVYYNPEEIQQNGNLRIKARQYRLNHKPFNYEINVNSKVAEEAIVRVYIGPKVDQYYRQIDIEDNRLNFVELDVFSYKLNVGQNLIERNSRQVPYANDRFSINSLYEAVQAALNGQQEFIMDKCESYYGYPNR